VYVSHMDRVPGVNLIVGVFRLLQGSNG